MGICVAKRKLLYAVKGQSQRRELVIRVSEPYLIEAGTPGLESLRGSAACRIDFDGIPGGLSEIVYGVDPVQALSLATDLDPYLKGLSAQYEFFWATGEPYFDD